MSEKLPYKEYVSSKYGAPMGRQSFPASEFIGKVHLRKVPLVDSAYDQGGTYWGAPANLWCAWDDHRHVRYMRAATRYEAKLDMLINLRRFYR